MIADAEGGYDGPRPTLGDFINVEVETGGELDAVDNKDGKVRMKVSGGVTLTMTPTYALILSYSLAREAGRAQK